MMKFLRDLFTGPSNTRWDLARVSLGLALLASIGFQGYSIYQDQEYDPLTFAGGIAALLVAGGLSISMKDKARPHSLLDGEQIVE